MCSLLREFHVVASDVPGAKEETGLAGVCYGMYTYILCAGPMGCEIAYCLNRIVDSEFIHA
jgi:hypothetical protein